MPVLPGPYDNYSVALSGKRLVTDALDLIGANDVADDPEPAILRRDLRTLNLMLDAWNTEKLVPYALTQFEGTLVSGTQDYLIGSIETFDTFRPEKINQGEAYLRVSGRDTELEVLTAQQWAALSDRTTLSGVPCAIYYEPGANKGTVSFYPNPSSAATFVLFRRQLLAQITNMNDIFYLPPGYAEAITNHLAIRLAPKNGKPVPQEVTEVAINSKANLKRNNMQPQTMSSDTAMQIWSGGGSDINSGGYR